MTKRKTATQKTTAPTPSLEEIVSQEVAKQVPKVETGIAVALPSTIEQKMEAICDLAETVKHLAIAIQSVNVNVRIEGCNLQNHSTGISVTTKEVRGVESR